MNHIVQAVQPKTKHYQKWSQPAEILAEFGSIDSSAWKLGIMPNLEDELFLSQIDKLSKTTEYPNPFFNLPFLSASIGNLGDNKKQFMFLSETVGEFEILKMFAPVISTNAGILQKPVLKVWTNLYAPLGVPLIDTKDKRTLNALIECLKTANHPTASTILLDMLPKQSAFQKELFISNQLARTLHRFSHSTRAMLKPGTSKSYLATRLSGKRKQRLNKGLKELKMLGEISFEKASSPSDIMMDFEEFLQLEINSWKGKKGTSLNTREQTSVFAHQALQNMAQDNRCMIYKLCLNNKAIASLVVFSDNGYYYPWKIAHDQTYDKYSPGNNLLAHVNHELYASKGFKGIDSLAAEDNKTAEIFWPDEQELYSMAIGIGKNGEQDAAFLAWEVYLKKRIKNLIKKLLVRLT